MHLLDSSIKTRSVCLDPSYVTKWHTCLPSSQHYCTDYERSSFSVALGGRFPAFFWLFCMFFSIFFHFFVNT